MLVWAYRDMLYGGAGLNGSVIYRGGLYKVYGIWREIPRVGQCYIVVGFTVE